MLTKNSHCLDSDIDLSSSSSDDDDEDEKISDLELSMDRLIVDRTQYRYQSIRELHHISGFIVNVHDATNFDIDLRLTPEQHRIYSNVINNTYVYRDLDDQLNPVGLSTTGCTYRCRLRGVGINKNGNNSTNSTNPTNPTNFRHRQSCFDIKKLIYRIDGWVVCTLSDIDVYKRLLVDICIPLRHSHVDMKEYLLTNYSDLYYPYTNRKIKS